MWQETGQEERSRRLVKTAAEGQEADQEGRSRGLAKAVAESQVASSAETGVAMETTAEVAASAWSDGSIAVEEQCYRA